MTYTYAILDVSPACYKEIARKLRTAGYESSFDKTDEGEVIDMHGIALRMEPADEVPASQRHTKRRSRI